MRGPAFLRASERGEDARDGDERAEQDRWCGSAEHELEGLGAGALTVEGHVWAAGRCCRGAEGTAAGASAREVRAVRL